LDDWIYCTYTLHSELQAITALPLISTIHSSPQHSLSVFQPAVSSPAVPGQRLLTVKILRLFALGSFLSRLSFRTACQLFVPELSINFSVATATYIFAISLQLFCQLPTPKIELSSTVDSQLSTNSQLAYGPHYIASQRTQQKTPFPSL
jgi:hypothetical protein